MLKKKQSSENINTLTLDANAKEYRLQHTAAEVAEIRMKDMNDDKSKNDNQQQ